MCELEQIAAVDQVDRLLAAENDINLAIQLQVDTTDEGGVAPTFSYMSAPFLFGSGFNYDRARDQSLTIQLFYSLAELRRERDNESKVYPGYSVCSDNFDTDLSGNLGLKEAFDLAITASKDLRWNAPGEAGAFGGYINFVVKRQLTATGPNWTLTHFKGPGSFATLASNTNNKLTYAFAQGKKTAKTRDELLSLLLTVNQNQLTTQFGNIGLALK